MTPPLTVQPQEGSARLNIFYHKQEGKARWSVTELAVILLVLAALLVGASAVEFIKAKWGK